MVFIIVIVVVTGVLFKLHVYMYFMHMYSRSTKHTKFPSHITRRCQDLEDERDRSMQTGPWQGRNLTIVTNNSTTCRSTIFSNTLTIGKRYGL